MTGMTTASSVLATTTPGVAARSLIWLSWVSRRIKRLERPAADTVDRKKSRRTANAACPATKKAMVNRSATGQLRKVPAKTPIVVRTMACSQIPNNPLKKLVPKFPASARR